MAEQRPLPRLAAGCLPRAARVPSLFVDADGQEKRSGERTPIELKVSYKRVNSFFADYTKNISRGGTFIGTERPLPMGTEFVFALDVPGLDGPLRIRGKVIWITEAVDATKANPAGMGIEFQYKDDRDRRDTEAVVERLLTRELGDHLATGLLGRRPQV
jgi:type IV pilus assembly protein PilZ